MRRPILVLLALVALALVVRWLVTRPVVQFRLGDGVELVTAPGVDGFAVREADDIWRLYDTTARSADDGRLLPVGVVGRPALQDNGSAFALTDINGLTWVHGGSGIAPGGERVIVLRPDALPLGARLEGVIGGRDPVLSAPVEGGRELLLCVDAPTGTPRLVNVRSTDTQARVPDGSVVVCARSARALAFVGEGGWESWLVEDTGLARRSVAEGCVRPGAVFAPDGRALLVPGRQDGLWLLSLRDGRLDLMAEGNLGISRRVAPSAGFRHEPPCLVAPQWNLEGTLQVYQTHLSGGGREAFGVSRMHHYGVALSPDGRFMSYTQARFDEQGDESFEEELYLFDFGQPADAAVRLGSRRGGLSGQGPAFLGNGDSLVYLEDGKVMRIEVVPHSADEGPP